MLNPKTEISEPATYSSESLQRLISILWNSREEPVPQSVLFYVVLGTFAGLRPPEAVALEWKYVDWIKQEIHLVPPIAKTARTIPIKENLLAFLHPFKGRNGLIVIHKRAANLLRNVCAEAGVKHIPNGLRRSYARYRLAETSTENVQREMGSDPSAVFEIGPITADEIEKYWSVRP